MEKVPSQPYRSWHDLPSELKLRVLSLLIPRVNVQEFRDPNRSQLTDFSNVHLAGLANDEEIDHVLQNFKPVFFRNEELLQFIQKTPSQIRKIIETVELSRTGVYMKQEWASELFSTDDVSAILIQNFPNLKKIILTMKDWCALLANYNDCLRAIDSDLQGNERAQLLNKLFYPDRPSTNDSALKTIFIPNQKKVTTIAKHFIASYHNIWEPTPARGAPGPRSIPVIAHDPARWISETIQGATSAGLEVIFEFNLCITHDVKYFGSGGSNPRYPATAPVPDPKTWKPEICYSHIENYRTSTGPWTLAWRQCRHYNVHIPAEMSTKDWIMRTTYAGNDYSAKQQSAYDFVYRRSNTTS